MVDVLLIAEGTYPYIRGGVSSWIDELLNGLKEFKFGVIFLGGKREDYEEIQYEFPSNLVYYSEIFLFDKLRKTPAKIKKVKSKGLIKELENFHFWFKRNLYKTDAIPSTLKNLNFYLKTLNLNYFLYSKEAWNFIVEMYSNFANYTPFIDYFCNIRNIHLPLFSVASVALQIPDFKVVHSPSTGYAGFLGSILAYNKKKAFIITEHGIYTRERKIDILNTDILSDRRLFLYKNPEEIDPIKETWIEFFTILSKLAYDEADFIVSLFENAKKIQIMYGANSKKCRVIPNGVDFEKFYSLLEKRPQEIPKIVALIGRVVPIKDIKTFIKSIKIASLEIPQIEGWIVGPIDEDPEYYNECLKFVSVLGLEEKIKFTGYKNIEEILPKIGLVTLTSISEGMPLIILEALASGVPCVTTDVGACKQILYGGIDEKDFTIGKAGEIVPIGDPEKTAKAYIELLTNKTLWKNYQKNGIERIKRYYTKEKLFDSYRNLYKEAIKVGRYRF